MNQPKPADANVPVDPTQLPVEVPLAPPPSVTTLITLQGFEQLVPVFQAAATLIRNFQRGGRTLTEAEHGTLVTLTAQMQHTADEMFSE